MDDRLFGNSATTARNGRASMAKVGLGQHGTKYRLRCHPVRRQALPPEAFIGVAELKRLYGQGNLDGVLPIIAISCCWETPAHPDPHGKQLATVAATLRCEMPKYAAFGPNFRRNKHGFRDMGIFWGKRSAPYARVLPEIELSPAAREPRVPK